MAVTTFISSAYYFSSIPGEIADLTVSNLQSARGIEGPQIILTWTKPVNHIQLSNLRIVRKMGSFPKDETDGKIVLDTVNVQLEYFTDFPNYGPEFFYYKIYSKRLSNWIGTYLTEAVELAHDTKIEVQDKFFKDMGEPYLAFDKVRHGSNQENLDITDLSIYEKILMSEDSTLDQGEFRRFLKIPNFFYNEILALTRSIATRDGLGIVHDVKRTKPQYLHYIAKLYGWRFNFDIPVDAARAELISIPEVYQKKGREDITLEFINNILLGHAVTLKNFSEVSDWNGTTDNAGNFPAGGFIDTTDIVRNVNFLTAANDIFVIVDINGVSTIGFNQVGINVIPLSTKMIKASEIQKLIDVIDDFFSILDDTFIIIHETFNLTFPTDFTTVGITSINTQIGLGVALIDLFSYFGLGQGQDLWDFGLTPTPAITDTTLVDEQYRDEPRNIVYTDVNWVPQVAVGKKVLVRCFVDINTITSLYNREVGIFSGGTSTVDTGTLLAEKFIPLRYLNSRVRRIVDFRIQFP